jgi:hypothetical protein
MYLALTMYLALRRQPLLYLPAMAHRAKPWKGGFRRPVRRVIFRHYHPTLPEALGLRAPLAAPC